MVFEINEEKALRKAYSKSIAIGKPFDIISFKKNREKARLKIPKIRF